MNTPTNQFHPPSPGDSISGGGVLQLPLGLHFGPLITTLKEFCGGCYACVRECPAKAIRIEDQKAEILPNRCIACGNCLKVCRRSARKVASDLDGVRSLLRHRDRHLVAVLDPAFPAEFSDLSPHALCDRLRDLGFRFVHQAAFGSDLVGHAYRRLLKQRPGERFIVTTCAAVVAYVERYHPELVPRLAPVVSPMIASARAIRAMYGPQVHIVYLAPCIARKLEARDPHVAGAVDAVLTFDELRELLERPHGEPRSAASSDTTATVSACRHCGHHACTPGFDSEPADGLGQDAEPCTPSAFDSPLGGRGCLSSLSGSFLQAAGLSPEAGSTDGIVAAGRAEFMEALREFAAGHLDARLLELRACAACVNGSGMTTDVPLLRRRARIVAFPRRAPEDGAGETVESPRFRNLLDADHLDLSRRFAANDQRIPAPSEERLREILAEMGKLHPDDEPDCGACGYGTCREHAVAIHKGLAEAQMCLPFTLRQLRRTCVELQKSNRELATTQEAFLQTEKLASMGQFAAGIAHEVNNPLSTVLMLAHVLLEETPANDPKHEDLFLIASEADRCKAIVSGLLRFARSNRVDACRVNVADLANQVIQSLQFLDHHTRVDLQVLTDDASAEVDREQFVQVLTNLASNAIDAMPDGGTLLFKIEGDAHHLRIRVTDSGVGIPAHALPRIFEPFYSTKKPGEGTGLGLAVTYGIVKIHHGRIEVRSNADPKAGPTGTTFLIEIPRERASIAERGGRWPATDLEPEAEFDGDPDVSRAATAPTPPPEHEVSRLLAAAPVATVAVGPAMAPMSGPAASSPLPPPLQSPLPPLKRGPGRNGGAGKPPVASAPAKADAEAGSGAGAGTTGPASGASSRADPVRT